MSEAVLSVSRRRLPRAVGSLFVAARWDGTRSRLAELRQHAPCRALFPRSTPDEPLRAVLVNTGGGLVEGDRIDVEAEAGVAARLVVTTQSAEKVYRSLGDDCRTATRLRVGARAVLEWLPLETILFDGARLSRSFEIDVESGGRLLAAECVVFGRTARGEKFTHGLLHDRWTVRRDGQLVWADALRLEGDIDEMIRRQFAFGDSAGFVTVVLVAPDAASFLPAARAAAERGPWFGGASAVNRLLVVRALAPSEAGLRRACEDIVAALRDTGKKDEFDAA